MLTLRLFLKHNGAVLPDLALDRIGLQSQYCHISRHSGSAKIEVIQNISHII